MRWDPGRVLAAVAGCAAVLLGPAAGAAAAEQAGGPVVVRWLGVAGFSIAAGDRVLLHDPYLSRPGLWALLSSRYQPDAAVLEPLLAEDGPAPELADADLVLVGHSHFDHLGDVPWLAVRSGATVAGSETTVQIARAYGVAEARTRRVDPGAAFSEGPFEIRVVESRHAPVLFGRVPLQGEITEPTEAPLHALSFVLGDARAYRLTHAPSGTTVFVLSSADVHPPALEKQGALRRVDLLLVPTMGRTPGYARALVESLRPRIVVPHHFERFTTPLDAPDAVAPSDPDDLAAFEEEVRDAAEELGVALELRRLDLFESLAVGALR